jgi:hypothetical protein
MLGRGSYVLYSVANVFAFDLTTGLRDDILTPRGPWIGDWPCALSTGGSELRPLQPKLGEVFAEPQRILIGGRRVGVTMRWRSAREHTRLGH